MTKMRNFDFENGSTAPVNAFEGTLIFQVFRLRNSVETRIEKVYY
jgi:hypothetical protein